MNVEEVKEAFDRYLHPLTYPVAVKMCESKKELPDKVKSPKEDMDINISLCHAIAMARRYGWVIAVDKHQTCWYSSIAMGFLPVPDDVADGSFQESLGLWGMNKEEAASQIRDMPKFEYGKYDYVLISPLHRTNYDPDLILFYGNPAQVWVLLSGYLMGTGERSLDVSLSQGGGCAIYIAKAIKTGEAKFNLVGTGERLVPNPKDYECVFSIPADKIDETIEGLEAGYEIGVFRYPIPSFLRYSSQHPPGYEEMRSHLLGEEEEE